jgi:hypothetical protein
MKKEWHSNYFIETDFTVDPNFWSKYYNNKWQDSNTLYSEYVSNATGGKEMNKFFVQEIHDFDRPLLKLIKNIWNQLGIRPNEFRCNFFKVLPGGDLPCHIDEMSKSSVVIPVTENTGALYFKDESYYEETVYDTMIVLNTKKPHGVKSPSKERIVFHMGMHDVLFSEIS